MLMADEGPPFGSLAPSPALARLIRLTRAMPEGWMARRIAYALRRIAMGRLTGPVDTEVLGARFRLHPFDNVCEKRILFTPQYFDPEELRILRDELHGGFVFVDVGANVGAYALHVAAQAGPGARVLAIEPQPEIFERLVHNIAQNPAGTVKAIACAVADRDGEVTLFLDARNRGESGVKFVRPELRAAGEASVPARTLLGLLEDEGLERVDALKLDVEGAEDLILEPFFGSAPRALWPRLIVLEHAVDRWQIDLLGLLRQRGYRVEATTRLNLVLIRADEGAGSEPAR
jgi:FkbM family methyltransferase